MKGTDGFFRRAVLRTVGTAALAFSFMAIAAGCGDISIGDPFIFGEDIPAELVGKWYNKDYDFTFEITSAGEGYIAEKKWYCTVAFSGNTVYFRSENGGSNVGSFRYAIKNGEMTMKSGTAYFRDLRAASPFIKFGGIPPGGRVPVELIGKWYDKYDDLAFEITPAGSMTIFGSKSVKKYTVSILGTTVGVLDGSLLAGEFQYVMNYDEMIIPRGATEGCAGLPYLSPFIKKNEAEVAAKAEALRQVL